MNFKLVPVPNIPANFPLDSLCDADADHLYRAINDWGFTPRAFFVLERIPELNEIFENDFYHV